MTDGMHVAKWVDRLDGEKLVGFELRVGTDIVLVSIEPVQYSEDGWTLFTATDEIRRKPILPPGEMMLLEQARLMATSCAVGICSVIGGVAPWIDPASVDRMARLAITKLQVRDA